MKTFGIGCGVVLVILLCIVVIAAVAVSGSYNRLVRLQQTVDQSWAQVQNVYQRRADLIPNLVNTVSGAANFEKSTLTEVTNARASVGRVQLDPNKAPTDAAQLEQFQAAQGQLSNALSRLLVVVERLSGIKSQPELSQFAGATRRNGEPDLGRARELQHRCAELQRGSAQFSDEHLIAGMLGFPPRPFFTAQAGAEKPPPVQFNFGPAPTPAANLNQGPVPTPATAASP